ncbi:piggyBac transposable element-derived protein 4-like [Aphis craccivora]|uniref:PiggyBac transposable element-derived protein 4-like n=1 Tax=Aphis craccivora TaxID=307492 RepID=A0A6G0YB69_APHCR|nr:piggyBac transposable element-derived protein 4-like [Aphis craccivora]
MTTGFQNSETHLPKKVPKNNKKRCKYCYAQGIRKDTIYFCNECQDQPGLCLDSFGDSFNKFL